MTRALFIPFDQLNRNYGALKDADPKTDSIVFLTMILSSLCAFTVRAVST